MVPEVLPLSLVLPLIATAFLGVHTLPQLPRGAAPESSEFPIIARRTVPHSSEFPFPRRAIPDSSKFNLMASRAISDSSDCPFTVRWAFPELLKLLAGHLLCRGLQIPCCLLFHPGGPLFIRHSLVFSGSAMVVFCSAVFTISAGFAVVVS